MTAFDDLSIVVPIGPNETAWRDLLKDLAVLGDAPEIILSACSIQPGEELPANVLWINGLQGRAAQLNAGARAASRRVIWFLHADSRLGEDAPIAVRRFIEMETQGLGYFNLRFAGDGPALTRLNALAANLRSRLFGLPFGDQGFLIDVAVFERLCGYDESLSLGEDLDFAVRCRSAGIPLRTLPAALTTSARRYRSYGWAATTWHHLRLTWQLTRQAHRRLAGAR